MPWVSPVIAVKWGDYFKADPEEQAKIVNMAQAALGKGIVGGGVQLVPRQSAVEKVASVFGLDNIDAVIEALDKEQAEADEKAAQQAEQEADNAIKIAAAKPAPTMKPAVGAPPGNK